MDDANADSEAPEGDAAPARTPSHAPLQGLLLAVSAAAAAEPADAADGAHPERAVSGASKDGLGTRRSIRKRPTSVRSEGRTEPASAAADAWPVAALGEKWDVAQAPPRLNPCGDLARGKLPDVHPPRRGPSAAAAAQQNDTSAFIGVSWATRERQWVVQVHHGGRKHYVGLFDDEREAARAFDGAARRLRPRGLAHGGRAGYQWKRVNFPTAAEQAFAEGEGMPDKKCKAQAALTLACATAGPVAGSPAAADSAAAAGSVTAANLERAAGGTSKSDRRGSQPVAPQQQCVTSAFVGVSWHKQEDRWVAQVNHGGRKHYVGLFADEEEAARAFDGAARRLRPTGKAHGGRSGNQWVRVNFPEVAEQAFAEGEGMPDKKSKAPRR